MFAITGLIVDEFVDLGPNLRASIIDRREV